MSGREGRRQEGREGGRKGGKEGKRQGRKGRRVKQEMKDGREGEKQKMGGGRKEEREKKGRREGREAGRGRGKGERKDGLPESFENFLRHRVKYFETVDNTTLYIVTYYTVLVCCLNHKLHANGLIHKPLTFFMSP